VGVDYFSLVYLGPTLSPHVLNFVGTILFDSLQPYVNIPLYWMTCEILFKLKPKKGEILRKFGGKEKVLYDSL
jgi:hypothetical protein